MTISTQRLAIIIILINIFIGICIGLFHETKSTYDITLITTQTATIETAEAEFGDEDKIYNLQNTEDTENTIGNPIVMSHSFWTILWNGINPLSFTPSDFDNEVEKIFASILTLFRSIATLVLMLELYLIFKNKKTT